MISALQCALLDPGPAGRAMLSQLVREERTKKSLQLLGGSWVVKSGPISKVAMLITYNPNYFGVLLTLLLSTHEPPIAYYLGRGPQGSDAHTRSPRPSHLALLSRACAQDAHAAGASAPQHLRDSTTRMLKTAQSRLNYYELARQFDFEAQAACPEV